MYQEIDDGSVDLSIALLTGRLSVPVEEEIQIVFLRNFKNSKII